MDEPCSALDPIATPRIEELMQELVSDYTIVIVTHNMQQAARVSDRTAFFTVEVSRTTGTAPGTLVEFDRTETIFTNPTRRTDRGLRHGAVRMTRDRLPRGSSSRWSSSCSTLGELAGTPCSASVEAVVQHDDDAAEAVIDGDDEIDELYLEHRPAGSCSCSPCSPRSPRTCGSSRRSCTSSLHLERIGDQAVNVAKLYQVTRDLPGNPTIVQQIGEMGHIVVEMVRIAMEAFAGGTWSSA